LAASGLLRPPERQSPLATLLHYLPAYTYLKILEVVVRPSANAVLRTNIINMLETHLPDERKAIAERRAALEAELLLLADYDSTLERIENAMTVSSRPTVFSLARKTGT
jgi:hypothetical protein